MVVSYYYNLYTGDVSSITVSKECVCHNTKQSATMYYVAHLNKR